MAMKALEHGKHVYGEKPFAVSREEGAEMLRLANEKNLRIGCAADTFLGAAAQTCRKLIDDGWIGEVIGATAFMCCHGHESWHPDPAFYYDTGGGPLLDMGPYYLAGLVNLAGPVKRVSALSSRPFAERVITSAAKNGSRIPVKVDTHISGSLEFESGAVGTLLMSFDVWHHSLPPIEIHGTEGSLSVPDPNMFGGEVRVCRGKGNWETVPLLYPHADNARGLGLLDMARAAVGGRPHRASGELAFHVLDVMLSLHESGSQGVPVDIRSTCAQPAAFPLNLRPDCVED